MASCKACDWLHILARPCVGDPCCCLADAGAAAAACVLHQDEELGVYRQRMQALDAYCKANTLPHVSSSSTWGLPTRQPGLCWLVMWSARSYLPGHM